MDLRTVIKGSIENYIYESSDSLYKVCELKLEDNTLITIVGNIPKLDYGLIYEFVGYYKEHQKYGRQFVIESYSKSNSFTEIGLINYLSSPKFYGIGEVLAKNIVEKLGLDCIEKIMNDENALDGIKGITKPKKQIIREVIKNNYLEEEVYVKLFSYGLTPNMIKRLIDKYDLNAANKIEENPYRLITEVEGFGFKKSDQLALNLGIKEDDERRIKAAIIYTLNYVCYQNGFTFLTKDQLINSSFELLKKTSSSEIDNSLIENNLIDLIESKKLIYEDDRIFDSILYNAEVSVKDSVNKLLSEEIKYKKEDIEKEIKYVEDTINISYTPLQKEAIINSLSNKISIITGGPGTGKSTILKGILLIYARLNNLSLSDDLFKLKVNLAAPTGRAAKRMEEATKMKASTIHKLLGFNYLDSFNKDEFNPLNCSLLIIDEVSMLDITLAKALFKAIPKKCQLILVGDSNQLPSVGPGNVLYDFINSNAFNVTKLNKIMRQSENSNIIRLSQMIMNEKIDYRLFQEKKEVYFYDRESSNTIDLIFKILDGFIENGGNIFDDIQILAPMYAGMCGIDAINKAIQERYNKSDNILVRNDRIFKKDDKVLQLKNDSELMIMNGDIGKIKAITKSNDKDYLIIDFDGKMVTYPSLNLDDLTLAYVISIHKSQGSEFKNVIMPILPSYGIMLRKKIIYTGITRAKEKLIIIGKIDAINRSIKQHELLRQTSLLERLSKDRVKKNNRILDLDIPFEQFGEYDMEGITPYTFMN